MRHYQILRILCSETNGGLKEDDLSICVMRYPYAVTGSSCKDIRVWHGKDGLVMRWNFVGLDWGVLFICLGFFLL